MQEYMELTMWIMMVARKDVLSAIQVLEVLKDGCIQYLKNP